MLVAGCAFVLLAKLALIWRIDVNWDELYSLNHVHTLLGGDLTLVLEGSYTHWFRWLPAVSPSRSSPFDSNRCLGFITIGTLTADSTSAE